MLQKFTFEGGKSRGHYIHSSGANDLLDDHENVARSRSRSCPETARGSRSNSRSSRFPVRIHQTVEVPPRLHEERRHGRVPPQRIQKRSRASAKRQRRPRRRRRAAVPEPPIDRVPRRRRGDGDGFVVRRSRGGGRRRGRLARRRRGHVERVRPGRPARPRARETPRTSLRGERREIARDERDRSDGETMNLPSKRTRQIVVARGRSRRIATHRFAGSLNGGEFFRAGDLFHHRSWTARACLATRRRRPTIAMDRPRAFFYDC